MKTVVRAMGLRPFLVSQRAISAASLAKCGLGPHARKTSFSPLLALLRGKNDFDKRQFGWPE